MTKKDEPEEKDDTISIHIPRVGDDADRGQGRTDRDAISIHIPRVGDDHVYARNRPVHSYFNPHPPCGG